MKFIYNATIVSICNVYNCFVNQVKTMRKLLLDANLVFWSVRLLSCDEGINKMCIIIVQATTKCYNK